MRRQPATTECNLLKSYQDKALPSNVDSFSGSFSHTPVILLGSFILVQHIYIACNCGMPYHLRSATRTLCHQLMSSVSMVGSIGIFSKVQSPDQGSHDSGRERGIITLMTVSQAFHSSLGSCRCIFTSSGYLPERTPRTAKLTCVANGGCFRATRAQGRLRTQEEQHR